MHGNCKPLNTAAIVAAYEAGQSAKSLARQHHVSYWTIRNRLQAAGIVLKSSAEQLRKVLNLDPANTVAFEELVDGLLLGDGSIRQEGALSLSQSVRREGWLEQVTRELIAVGASSQTSKPKVPPISTVNGQTIVGGPKRVLSTPAYVELQAQRQRWYPDGTKHIPGDLRLTPRSLAHWFAGDGTYDPHGYLYFCTQGFPDDEIQWLADQMTLRFGIETALKPTQLTHRVGYVIAVTRRDNAMVLRRIIEPYLPDCVRYKLRYVRGLASVSDYSFNKNFTAVQIREIRERHRAGENYSRLSQSFGVTSRTIKLIVTGQTYRNVA